MRDTGAETTRRPAAQPSLERRDTRWWLPPPGSEPAPCETSEKQPNPLRGELPSGGSPPGEAAPGDQCTAVEQLSGRPTRAPAAPQEGGLPSGGPPPTTQAQARSNLPSHATATDPLTDFIIHTAQQLHAFCRTTRNNNPLTSKPLLRGTSESGRNQVELVTKSSEPSKPASCEALSPYKRPTSKSPP